MSHPGVLELDPIGKFGGAENAAPQARGPVRKRVFFIEFDLQKLRATRADIVHRPDTERSVEDPKHHVAGVACNLPGWG